MQTQQQIEVICVCEIGGTVRPLRFRMEDEAHLLHVVQITEIISTKHTQYIGIESIVYCCRATVGETEHLFELRYTIRTLKWVLVRILY